MAESEELKTLFMKAKGESEKAGLKLNIQKAKITASGPIPSWQIVGETVETVRDFVVLQARKQPTLANQEARSRVSEVQGRAAQAAPRRRG